MTFATFIADPEYIPKTIDEICLFSAAAPEARKEIETSHGFTKEDSALVTEFEQCSRIYKAAIRAMNAKAAFSHLEF